MDPCAHRAPRPAPQDRGAPVLLLHGTEDVSGPRAAAERAARALPDATLVPVDGAGHWVTRDAPDDVLRAVLRFLDRSERHACHAR